MKKFSETVKNSADIVRLVSEYVSLKGAGNTLKGLCPFHSEKTPSFTVHRDRQFFHCFGCNVGGDVFSFVELMEKISFPESVRLIAEMYGIPVPSEADNDGGKGDERRQLFEFNERANAFFQKAIASDQGEAARQVLKQRKVLPEFAERFQLGYAPPSGLMAVLKAKDPASTGLFIRNDRGDVYDRFRHRLMFPIWNERGKVIAFGGRVLGDGEPKYLNSPETPLYSKSYVLYALHLAREAAQRLGRMIVVEGYFDCLSLHQAGVTNVVASCGTSLTTQQVGLMARYVPEIVMNYDPDAAGQNAMRRSIELLLAKGLRIRILHLPGGLDPDDFVRRHGAETYNRLLEKAPYHWQYLMTQAMQQYDLSDPSMKANAVRDVLQSVARIQDRVERLEVAKAVAEGFQIPAAVLYEQLHLTPGRPEVKARVPASRTASRKALKDSEKQLIHALLQDREVGRSIQAFLESEFLREAWSFPVIAGLIQSPDGDIEEVLRTIPDEDLRGEIRSAVFEPFARITAEQALASIAQLYDAHLVKKEMEIREQLKQYGSGPAPADLVRKQQEIALEKSRVKTLRP